MLLGVVVTALGVVTLRTGWVPPWTRRHVTRPRLQGIGALLVGLAVFLPGLVYFGVLPGLSWEARFFGRLALMFSGLVCVAMSQLLPPAHGKTPRGRASQPAA
ncbi:hypothetical protein R6L23_18730 [Streptomyces sp. SR27]|uniref:hypothetical protein n=1 Tax=Streptomyces sp. SR27 TaxID=3076630 RepID=UPI00295B878F|nr:hypothetical protein [Streptomyces sp. SR27]MDV9190220.1 hypothetical protein [Streptomyces sp. SR27]